MTKTNTGVQPVKDNPAKSGPEEVAVSVGSGGEWHQTATGDQSELTTNLGLPVSDRIASLPQPRHVSGIGKRTSERSLEGVIFRS